VGERAAGLSARVVVRLEEQWCLEHEQWGKRSLSGKQYVYIGADSVQAKVRLEDDGGKKRRLLVLMTFYDFPTERWNHLHKTNPIEST
jgi:transposase-like protein